MTWSCLAASERRQEDVRRNVSKGSEILNSVLSKTGGYFQDEAYLLWVENSPRIHWSGMSVGEMKNSCPCMDLHLDIADRRWLFCWLNISTVTMFILSNTDTQTHKFAWLKFCNYWAENCSNQWRRMSWLPGHDPWFVFRRFSVNFSVRKMVIIFENFHGLLQYFQINFGRGRTSTQHDTNIPLQVLFQFLSPWSNYTVRQYITRATCALVQQ